jgi:hypothetical protein
LIEKVFLSLEISQIFLGFPVKNVENGQKHLEETVIYNYWKLAICFYDENANQAININ